MQNQAATGRLVRGKKVKAPRGSRLVSRNRSRRARATATRRRASRRRATNSPPRAESQARPAQPGFSRSWRDLLESGHPFAEYPPEERELRQKRTELSVIESQLAGQQRLLSRLQAEMLPFEVRYFRKVGIRCARLDEIEARIAEIHASVRPEDAAAQDAALRARERANRSQRALARRSEKEKIDPPPALKRLYHAVARRVHPDLGESAADRHVRERLMAHANRAYESGDERRLCAIVREYEFCPETVKGEGTPADLVRVIRKIAQSKERLEEIREEMERVQSSDLYRFKLLVESKAKQGRDLFADVVARVNTRIAASLLRLSHLEAGVASESPRRIHSA